MMLSIGMQAQTFERIFITAAIILSCLSPSLATTGDAASNQTLVLQQHQWWYDKVTICLNKNSMLVELPPRKIEVYTKAPEWTVICRNSNRHQYSSTPYEDWIKHGPSVSFSGMGDRKSIKTATETNKGLPVARYVFPRKYKTGQLAPLSVGNEGYALVYQGPEVTDQAAKVLDALLERWNAPGIQLTTYIPNFQTWIPYRISDHDKGTPKTLCSTLSWSRTKTKPVFDLKGYKLAGKAREVWYSEKDLEMMQDFGGQ
jgi:hypothetical protein